MIQPPDRPKRRGVRAEPMKDRTAANEPHMDAQFVKVAELEGLQPGSMQRVKIGEHRILLANVGGRIHAADDTCTHEDASLSTGSLDGEWVKCPLHGSRFNVRTGQVVDEPAEANLRTYAVRVEDGSICVCIDPGGA
ncbi:MAG: non-heme iron oxygenase ferredoxin subunit [Betaproteobacteria bacterium]